MGVIKEDVGVMELLPGLSRTRGIPDPLNPRRSDSRALQMGARGGIITEGILKKLQARGIDVNSLPLAVIISSAAAYGLLPAQETSL